MIRTLEELEEVNYENLTYEEFCEYDLDCEQYCPLYGEECDTSFVLSYSGQSMEPPCQCFDKKESMQKIYTDILSRHKQYEEYEDRQLQLKKEKEERSQQRKQKLYEYRTRNYDELQLIQVLKNQIKDFKNSIDKINISKIYAESVNTVNEMFRQCKTDCPKDIQTDQITLAIEKLNDGISQCQQLIVEIRAKIKQKK